MKTGLTILLAQYLISTCLAHDSISSRGTANTTLPAPLVIPPSQYFEGNDGPWSTFNLRVGTPSQDVRVLISTTASDTYVVLSEYGCSTRVFKDIPSNCANSRGLMFNPNTSTTWEDQGFYEINKDGVGLEANLGYVQTAQFGHETVGLGIIEGGNGPTLKNQSVAGIASASPFYLGMFGLNSQPSNFTTLGNSSSSYFQSLKDAELIPSLSWSYTAGAKYRLKQVYGQLIFGGYDTSRFVSNDVSFDLAGDIGRDIVLALQSITFSGNTQSSLLSSPIWTFIDSTDANIWLPASACKAFESAFGLTLDNSTGLYLLNESHHNTLLSENPSVTFRLSDSLTGGYTVTIIIPYSAFDLQAIYPLVNYNTSSFYYFPLKKADNETQYTLGRTFLQEAYLTVDYERGNFSVSQCEWIAGSKQQITTIYSKDYKEPTTTESSIPSSSSVAGGGKKGLATGAIAGIAVGIIAVFILIGAIAFTLLRRRKRIHSKSPVQLADTDSKADSKWPEEGDLEHLRAAPASASELSNESLIHQLHSNQKAFEGQEMDAGWRKPKIPELPGDDVPLVELEAPTWKAVARLK